MIALSREAACILSICGSPRTGVELGVRYGRTAFSLLALRPDLHLTLVDDWHPENEGPSGDPAYSKAMEAVEPFEGRVTVLRERSPGAAAAIPDASQDFVHVDADHLYDSVLSDCRAWWPKVRPGGFLIGHDYGNHSNPEWAVALAVRDFSGEIGVPFNVVQMPKDPCGTWWMEKG